MARITLVSRNFPPLSGGMERLVHELFRGLVNNHQVRLLGPKGCEKFVSSGSGVSSTSVSPTLFFLFLTLLKGVFGGRGYGAPEIVMGGSGLVGPVVILLAKLSGAKSVLLLHGLDIVADSRIYQWFFVPLLKRADMVICNSKYTARLAIDHGVNKDNVVIVNPGVDVHAESTPHDVAKRALGLDGKKVLLSVGRLMPRKGLAEFITNTFVNLAADPGIVLLVVGGEPGSALNRPKESVLAKIEATVEKHGIDGQVQLLGHTDDDELAVLYSAADVFVFPLIKIHGDVEGFGMVAIEAAAHGTPTVAFDCGGVGDAVVNGVNGVLVDAANYAEFGSAIIRVVQSDMRDSAREFASQFSWENYGAQIEQCIDKVLT